MGMAYSRAMRWLNRADNSATARASADGCAFSTEGKGTDAAARGETEFQRYFRGLRRPFAPLNA
jgi:hypothetical protein